MLRCQCHYSSSLSTHQFISGSYSKYLTFYSDSLRQQLEDNGKPITECLHPSKHTHTHTQTDGQSNNIIPLAISIGWVEASTSSSATADGPRDVMCQSKFCQLLQNSVRTSCTTNPEQIEAMVLEGYSRRMGRRHQRSRRLPVNLVNHPVIQAKPETPPADRIHEQNEQDPSRCCPAPSSIRQTTSLSKQSGITSHPGRQSSSKLGCQM